MSNFSPAYVVPKMVSALRDNAEYAVDVREILDRPSALSVAAKLMSVPQDQFSQPELKPSSTYMSWSAYDTPAHSTTSANKESERCMAKLERLWGCSDGLEGEWPWCLYTFKVRIRLDVGYVLNPRSDSLPFKDNRTVS